MARVVVCDLGIGNLRSVVRAVSLGGADVEIAAEPAAMARADAVIVPGQGAFRDGAAALSRGFGDALRGHIESGRPYLGICLGLQLLFDTSDESPGSRGLGILAGHVARIPTGAAPGQRSPLKLPHIGWNEVLAPTGNHSSATPRCTDALAPLFGKQVYFAHSYVAAPEDDACVAAVVDYGGPLVCAVARDNVLAVQFHPEKSQKVGLRFLAAWLEGISGARS
jgi:glutamine amidotransferase